jgi:hypothetical protein
MPEFGVWIDGEASREQFTWRGTAVDRDEARTLAVAAFRRRYGSGPIEISEVIQIEPGDAGYGRGG